MSFRKRNVGLTGDSVSFRDGAASESNNAINDAFPGTRPSPVDGQSTTSTGIQSLDNLLGGHGGVLLGHSILLEECGTTDNSSVLLRCFAAEGVLQGHHIHVLGVGEAWAKELPGEVDRGTGDESRKDMDAEKMKIAWRYQKLEGSGVSSKRIAAGLGHELIEAAFPANAERSKVANTSKVIQQEHCETSGAFCHGFDLTKRMNIPASATINHLHPDTSSRAVSPFVNVLEALSRSLSSSPNAVHRLVIPAFLSPAIYPPHANQPRHAIQFMHGIRSLLRRFPRQLATMMTVPLQLYPRLTGLVRWIEVLVDGVFELVPFTYSPGGSSTQAMSGGATEQEERPQGNFKVHKLPAFHDLGGGGSGQAVLGDDMAFTISRRNFVIKAFSLPPADGDRDVQQGHVQTKSEGSIGKDHVDF